MALDTQSSASSSTDKTTGATIARAIPFPPSPSKKGDRWAIIISSCGFSVMIDVLKVYVESRSQSVV